MSHPVPQVMPLPPPRLGVNQTSPLDSRPVRSVLTSLLRSPTAMSVKPDRPVMSQPAPQVMRLPPPRLGVNQTSPLDSRPMRSFLPSLLRSPTAMSVKPEPPAMSHPAPQVIPLPPPRLGENQTSPLD